MKIPERSPDIVTVVNSGPIQSSADTIRYAKEYNEKYLHWDDLKYREFGESNRTDVWRMMKVMRIMSYRHVKIKDIEISYSLFDDYTQKTLHEIDSRIASGFLTSNGIDDKRRIMLSVSSMMEESIASSQLEGASTTTKLAKKLLRSNLPPKDDSQKMILNNYRAMQLIKDRLGKPLSLDLIKEIHQIYLDNAATTVMKKEAIEAMQPYFSENYGNPSSIHSMSKAPRDAVKAAREIIARTLNAEPDEIYFTSGGTESDNWALCSSLMLNPKGKKHAIVSAIEHHAILETADFLEKMGYEITRVGVDEDGVVKLDELEKAIRPDTALISVMTANNEIGTIEPVREIAKIAHDHGVLFHTDAVQAYAHIPIDVKEIGIDLLSASGPSPSIRDISLCS